MFHGKLAVKLFKIDRFLTDIELTFNKAFMSFKEAAETASLILFSVNLKYKHVCLVLELPFGNSR